MSQPAARLNYVKPAKAAVAYGHVVRGDRAVFDGERGALTAVFWAGTRKTCILVFCEEPAVLSLDMHAFSTCAASGVAVPWSASCCGELTSSTYGIGAFLDHAVAPRAAAPTATAVFGVRRASEVVQPLTSDAALDLDAGLATIKAVRQKDDRAGVGRLAFFVAALAWSDACSVCAIANWLRFRNWLKVNKDRCGRTARERATVKGGALPYALYAGLSRAHYGFGMSAAGFAADIKKAFGGRVVSSRKGGALLYVSNAGVRRLEIHPGYLTNRHRGSLRGC